MIRNIKKVIAKLGNGKPADRRKAAEELAEGDERGIYPLIKALSDENTGVQDAAMRSLISMGGEIVAYMVLPLLRENSYLRNTGLIIMKQLGGVSVPLLYPLLKDKDHDIRKFAIDLLSEIQEGVNPSQIVPSLEDPNANVRAAAAKALGDLRWNDAIPRLIQSLGDEEWVCFYALQSLGDLKAEQAAPAIAALLSSPSEVVRFSAIETMGKLGSAAVLPALISYLSAASGDEKLATVKSIIQIGVTPGLTGLIPHIVRLYSEGDWEDKEIALRGFSELKCREAVPLLVETAGSLDPFSSDAEERTALLKQAILYIGAEEELLNLLDSPHLKYRGKSFVIDILGESKSRKAAGRLSGYLKDVSRDLRRVSAEALGEIGETAAVEELMETSQSDADAHVRRSAIEALGNIGSKEAYKVLKGLLEVEIYPDLLDKIVESLLKIDQEAFLTGISEYSSSVRQIIARLSTDINTLMHLSEDADPAVKISAIGGMGHIGSSEAIERIISFLGQDDPEVRKAAVVSLGDAGLCSDELVKALGDPDPWVRFYAVKSVASVCDPDAAIGKISGMLNDSYVPVIMAAVDAIRDIGGREAFEALASHEEHENGDVRAKIREALDAL
ncbi:MAG TPA: HEAT repeat domain-containing protein [Dissulfurispiraceae bacterium]|nr:HEAT repeat domain-containing protein [Dissulfurispiraceae bacterium]